MTVIGGGKRDPQILRQLKKLRKNGFFFLQVMILDLDIVVVFAKDLLIFCCGSFSELSLTSSQQTWDLACNTARQPDKAVVIFF